MPSMLIYGSCVSRDTKAHFPDWEGPVYVARQSMISSDAGPVELRGESQLSSDFQNKMIRWDQLGNGFDLVLEALPRADLLLIDLVDERRGVWEITPDRFVTNSFELHQSRLIDAQSPAPRLVPFGTDEHFRLWSAAARTFVAEVQSSTTPAFVFAPAWATRSVGGKSMAYLQRSASEWNALYVRYHAFLAHLGLPLLTAPHHLTVADEQHVWGLEPFHYVRPFYEHMRDEVLARI